MRRQSNLRAIAVRSAAQRIASNVSLGATLLTLLMSVGAGEVVAAPKRRPVVPGIGQSPEQFVRTLYSDVVHRSRVDPLWWHSLSNRTRALHERLKAFERRTGTAYLDADWLCQCQDPGGLRIVSLTSSREPHGMVLLTLITTNARLRLLLVNEGGWKIDDMIDVMGNRFTAELERGIESYRHGG